MQHKSNADVLGIVGEHIQVVIINMSDSLLQKVKDVLDMSLLID